MAKRKKLSGIMGVIALTLVGIPRASLAGCFPYTVTVEVEGCPEVGSEFSAWVSLTNATEEVSAGQFYLEYSTAVFDIVATDVTPGDPPFTIRLHRSVDRELGRVFYVIQAPDGTGTAEDSVMMRMTFQVVSDQGAPFIRFINESPRINKLILVSANPVIPHRVNAGAADTIDLEEVARFQNCFVGEGTLATPECACLFDYNADLDVDLADYQALSVLLGSPYWPCKGP